MVLAGCGGAGPPPEDRPFDADLDVAEPARAPAAASPAVGPGGDAPHWTVPDRRPRQAPAARPMIHRGRRVDLDFKEVELADVFRLLADAGGVNIVVADDVKGKLTLRLRRVPWDQALDTVVKVKKLKLERNGDIYLVTRP